MAKLTFSQMMKAAKADPGEPDADDRKATPPKGKKKPMTLSQLYASKRK